MGESRSVLDHSLLYSSSGYTDIYNKARIGGMAQQSVVAEYDQGGAMWNRVWMPTTEHAQTIRDTDATIVQRIVKYSIAYFKMYQCRESSSALIPSTHICKTSRFFKVRITLHYKLSLLTYSHRYLESTWHRSPGQRRTTRQVQDAR